jgi:hypothetical protein
MGFWDSLSAFIARQQQLDRIERTVNRMDVNFTDLDQKVTNLGTAVTAGFDKIGAEVLDTAQLVKELRDKVSAGVDVATIQAHLDSIAGALETTAAGVTSKAAEVAASLDAIQNPPAPPAPADTTPPQA